jgi:hypothetical protein
MHLSSGRSWLSLSIIRSRTATNGIAVAFVVRHAICDANLALDVFARLPPQADAAVAHTEDPPFGGLWCDQPAPFFALFYWIKLPAAI